jgi:Ni/Co efflux regulator RcnB
MKNPFPKLNRWLIAVGLGAACVAAPFTASAEPNIGDILKEQARRELNKDYDRRHDRDRDFERDRNRDRRDWNGGYRDSTDAAVQRALSRRGYYDGPADGSLGSSSRRAISRFQRDNGLQVTGTVTPGLLRALRI